MKPFQFNLPTRQWDNWHKIRIWNVITCSSCHQHIGPCRAEIIQGNIKMYFHFISQSRCCKEWGSVLMEDQDAPIQNSQYYEYWYPGNGRSRASIAKILILSDRYIAGYRNNAVTFVIITFSTAMTMAERKSNIRPPKDTSRASYGVPFVRILKKINRVITAPHCSLVSAQEGLETNMLANQMQCEFGIFCRNDTQLCAYNCVHESAIYIHIGMFSRCFDPRS